MGWVLLDGGWWRDRRQALRHDLLAGLLAAIVALPLGLGYTIAAGIDPAIGIYAAIIAGFAAMFGGSEYMVSGPSGGLVVLILTVVSVAGMDGLVLATLLAGVILFLMGVFRLGKIVEYIPSPMIIGYMAGTAGIIFFGQLTNVLGTVPAYPAGVSFARKAWLAVQTVPDARLPALILAALTIVILVLIPRYGKRVPASVVALVVATLLSVALPDYFAVRTIGDLAPIPASFPLPHLPVVTWPLLATVLPTAFAIAILVAIESLMTAVVADGITGKRHDSNKELIGQSVANVACALFGAIPTDGALSRTAANIDAGATSRLAAVFHGAFLLAFLLLVGGIIDLVPLAALAGLLLFIAYNMVDWNSLRRLFRTPLSDVALLLTTFLLTVFVSLTVALEVGAILAAVLFMKRISDLYRLEELESKGEGAQAFQHPDISIYTVYGPLFFGAASRFDQEIAWAPGGRKPIKILRMSDVPVIDATGMNFLLSTAKKHRKAGGAVLFAAVHPDVLRVLRSSGILEEIGEDRFYPTTKAALRAALALAHRRKGEPETMPDEELATYDLAAIDERERHAMPTRDKDPVEDILDSLGVTYIAGVGHKTITRTIEAGEVAISATMGAGKNVIGKTATKVIDATTKPLRRKNKK